jgi:hypothetical protein
MFVARHARQPVDDRRRAGGLERIADDLNGPFLDPLARPVGEEIALQSVRQVENHLAAIALEGHFFERISVELRPQRAAKQVARALVGLEIVASPVSAMHGIVPVDQAVLIRHTAGRKPGPHQLAALEVGLGIDAQLLFQLLGLGRQLEHCLVQRRPRGIGDEPVGPDIRQVARGQPINVGRNVGQLAVGRTVELQAVRIDF